MDIFETQFHLNNLKLAERRFREQADIFGEAADYYDKLVKNLEDQLEQQRTIFKDLNSVRMLKLKNQTLETRKEFVKANFFNEYDIEKLSGILAPYIGNNIPALELFPGIGQFLPHAVAAEPLYVADRYMDICIEASTSLNNEFYATRRLRKYEITDNNVIDLPYDSFGLVYCFNEFFSANEDYIIEIGNQVHKLLYDGGKFVFNFMPYDQPWAQVASINYQYSCLDYHFIIAELEKLGFVLVNYNLQPVRSSYIVMQKGNAEPLPRNKISGAWAEIIDS